MSKGLGKCYYQDEKVKQWHLNAQFERFYCVTEQGQKLPMPRYYEKYIYGDSLKETKTTIIQRLRDQLEEDIINQRVKLQTVHQAKESLKVSIAWMDKKPQKNTL